eukprot:symbB.v1.2.032449.t1/scaffold3897.1/size48720/5
MGKVHGSLARAGKVKNQTPKVAKAEKKKKLTGRAKKRFVYNRRFVSVVKSGPKRGPNSNAGKKLLSFLIFNLYSRRTGAARPWVGDRNLYKSSLVWEVKPVKPNVDYARFEVLVNQVEAEEAGIAVAVCGCRGWNSEAVNGIYHQDGTLNGDGTRWLKFTDDQKWMVSRHPDGRPLGEAFTEPDETCPTNPKSLRGPWFEMKWEENCEISVTAAECAGCGKSLRRIHRCSKCRAVGYCGLPCQKADWRFHKRVCASPEHTSLEDVWEGTDKTTAPRSDVPPNEESDFSVSRGMTDSHASDRSNWVPRRNSGSKQNWQEICLWVEWPEEREGLPALHVECEGGGYVEVSGVKEIDGLASVWPNQGDRRHLFDLAFQDFTTNLVKDLDLKDSETEAFVCGMSVSFAPSSESNLDGPRTAAQTTIAPASRRAILEALGANARAIYRGHGLMHLVHLRLQRFADEFDTK